MKHAIKIHSEMTDNSVYIIGADADELDDISGELSRAFFRTVYADEYDERDAFAAYWGIIDDYELEEIDDTDGDVDESELNIVREYSTRF